MRNEPEARRWWLDPLGQPAGRHQFQPGTVLKVFVALAVIDLCVAAIWLMWFFVAPGHPPFVFGGAIFFLLQGLVFGGRVRSLRRKASAAPGD